MVKHIRQLLLAALGTVLFSAPVFAQTAQKVENLLNEKALTWGAAAAFALEASETLLYAPENDAFQFAAYRKWLPKNAAPGDTASLNGVALLLMRSFGLKGGFLYSAAKNPHYAYRELVYKGVIQGKTDPRMQVSGDYFLFMINRILALQENAGEKAAAAAESRRRAAEEERRRAEEENLVKEINAKLAAQKVADTSARVTAEGITISLSNIQFRANSAELMETEKAKIREIARILEGIPERRLLVAGHTALAGTREEQQRTSLARAQSVANYLVSLRVRTAAEITVQGFGADRPVADNSTEAGMAQNRRVEITIIQGGGNR